MPLLHSATLPVGTSQLLVGRRSNLVKPATGIPAQQSLSATVGQRLSGLKVLTDVLTRTPRPASPPSQPTTLVDEAPVGFADIHIVGNGAKPNLPHSNLGVEVRYMPRSVWNNLQRGGTDAGAPRRLGTLLQQSGSPENAGFALLQAAPTVSSSFSPLLKTQAWQFLLRRTDSGVPVKGPHPQGRDLVASPQRKAAEKSALQTDVLPPGREIVFVLGGETSANPLPLLHNKVRSAELAGFLLSDSVIDAAEASLNKKRP